MGAGVAEETAAGVHLLYSAIYFRGRVDGYLAADKNPSEHSYQVASGHTHTHTHSHLVAADNKSLLALLFSFQSRRDLKAAKRLRRLKLFTSHFLPTLCSSRRRCVSYTAEQSPPGSTAPLAKL